MTQSVKSVGAKVLLAAILLAQAETASIETVDALTVKAPRRTHRPVATQSFDLDDGLKSQLVTSIDGFLAKGQKANTRNIGALETRMNKQLTPQFNAFVALYPEEASEMIAKMSDLKGQIARVKGSDSAETAAMLDISTEAEPADEQVNEGMSFAGLLEKHVAPGSGAAPPGSGAAPSGLGAAPSGLGAPEVDSVDFALLGGQVAAAVGGGTIGTAQTEIADEAGDLEEKKSGVQSEIAQLLTTVRESGDLKALETGRIEGQGKIEEVNQAISDYYREATHSEMEHRVRLLELDQAKFDTAYHAITARADSQGQPVAKSIIGLALDLGGGQERGEAAATLAASACSLAVGDADWYREKEAIENKILQLNKEVKEGSGTEETHVRLSDGVTALQREIENFNFKQLYAGSSLTRPMPEKSTLKPGRMPEKSTLNADRLYPAVSTLNDLARRLRNMEATQRVAEPGQATQRAAGAIEGALWTTALESKKEGLKADINAGIATMRQQQGIFDKYDKDITYRLLERCQLLNRQIHDDNASIERDGPGDDLNLDAVSRRFADVMTWRQTCAEFFKEGVNEAQSLHYTLPSVLFAKYDSGMDWQKVCCNTARGCGSFVGNTGNFLRGAVQKTARFCEPMTNFLETCRHACGEAWNKAVSTCRNCFKA